MISSPCPECGESVSVPEAAFDLDAQGHDPQAQCPWCGETTPLSQWSRQPMARLFDRDGQPLELLDTHAPQGAPAVQGNGPLDSMDSMAVESHGAIESQETSSSFASVASLGAMAGAGGGLLGAGLASVGLSSQTADEDDIDLADLTDQDESRNEIGDADHSGWSPDEMGSTETVIKETSEIPSFGDSVEPFDAGEIQLDGVDQGSSDDFMLSDSTADIPDRPKPMRVKPAPPGPPSKKSSWKPIVGAMIGPFLALGLAYGAFVALDRVPDWGFWPFDGKSPLTKTRAAAVPVRNDAVGSSTRLPSQRNGPSPLSGETPINPELAAIQSELGQVETAPSDIAEIQNFDIASSDDEASATDPVAMMPAATPDWEMPLPETASKPESIEEAPLLGMSEPDDVQPDSMETAAISNTPAFEIEPLPEETKELPEESPTAPAGSSPFTEVEIIPDIIPRTMPEREPRQAAPAAPKSIETRTVAETAEVAELADIARRMVRITGNESLDEETRRNRIGQTYSKLCELAELNPGSTASMQRLIDEVRNSSVVDLYEKIGPRYFDKKKPSSFFLIGSMNASRNSIELQGGKSFSLTEPAPPTLSGKVIAFGRVPNPNSDSLKLDLLVAEKMDSQ